MLRIVSNLFKFFFFLGGGGGGGGKRSLNLRECYLIFIQEIDNEALSSERIECSSTFGTSSVADVSINIFLASPRKSKV